MFSRITRLELVIVVGALLLLVFLTRPPTSGNADIRLAPPVGADAGPRSQDPRFTTMQPQPGYSTSSQADAQRSSPETPADITAMDSATSDPDSAALPVPPKVKRIGMVDARNCSNLNYKDVMYGEVAVRWIWNGQKFEARKVLEVKEKDGVTSIWTFDENDNIITSEVRQEPVQEN